MKGKNTTAKLQIQKYREKYWFQESLIHKYESIKEKKKKKKNQANNQLPLFFLKERPGFPGSFLVCLRRRSRDVTELLWKYTGAKPRRNRFVAAHPLLAPCKNSQSQTSRNLPLRVPFPLPLSAQRKHELFIYRMDFYREAPLAGVLIDRQRSESDTSLEACRSKAGAPVAAAFSTRSSYFSACRQAYHYRLDWKHTVLDHPATVIALGLARVRDRATGTTSRRAWTRLQLVREMRQGRKVDGNKGTRFSTTLVVRRPGRRARDVDLFPAVSRCSFATWILLFLPTIFKSRSRKRNRWRDGGVFGLREGFSFIWDLFGSLFGIWGCRGVKFVKASVEKQRR